MDLRFRRCYHFCFTRRRTYFDPDDDLQAATPSAMDRYLRDMLDALVKLAIEHGSPVLADHLKSSARKHGSAKLTAVSLKMVEEASKLAAAVPAAGHGIGMWFRPLVARRLKGEKIATLGELIDLCNQRGGSWWRSIPRIGPGRASRIVAWLRRHEVTIGRRVDADVDLAEPFKADDAQIVEIGGRHQVLAPLERMALQHGLSGATGANRSPMFALIHARNDLEAIRDYLYRFREEKKTLRSYTKELERFLLWAIYVRKTPLSSLLVEDCEAYKDFLAAPSPAFVGPRAPRHSHRWRPFSSYTLSPESQKYAARALRSAFSWLVDVRYLAGNPWKAVKDPATIRREAGMDIGRALSASLWHRVRSYIDGQCANESASYWRTVRVVLLLSGDSGLRREEITGAARAGMRESTYSSDDFPVWELTVVGKRKIERTVPVSPATVDALRAHWRDRKKNFDDEASGPLVKPIFLPPTPQAKERHKSDTDLSYAPDSLNDMVAWAMKRLRAGIPDLSNSEIAQLEATSPHAFRHTFGTQAAAEDVPVDIIQRILGHRSLQTTTIYVQAKKQRMMKAAAKYYAADAASESDDD
ncbi:phage integrase family protein [Paraburkholderia gardini]|uniref:phage integrase family protein n=1 Tax=Paraburkholderia gardini TaxID=2823469 RepID=UPI001DF1BB9B|nr:phage integrase family protein [Paraburkholderia gardini]CAG4914412.1 Tyrosine recombinase XerC [Paraburkholderia gardini]